MAAVRADGRIVDRPVRVGTDWDDTKTSVSPLVSPGTRFVSPDVKAIRRASVLSAGASPWKVPSLRPVRVSMSYRTRPPFAWTVWER